MGAVEVGTVALNADCKRPAAENRNMMTRIAAAAVENHKAQPKDVAAVGAGDAVARTVGTTKAAVGLLLLEKIIHHV